MLKSEKKSGFAEQLTLLLDAIVEEAARRAAASEDAIAVERLLAEDGELRKRFVELANQVRDVSGLDLALIEWIPKVGMEPMVMIHDGDESEGEWPLWRRIA